MTRDTFCYIDQPGCSHDRCVRTRGGDATCDGGHPLRADGHCEKCDAVNIPFNALIEALERSGCQPLRVDEDVN